MESELAICQKCAHVGPPNFEKEWWIFGKEEKICAKCWSRKLLSYEISSGTGSEDVEENDDIPYGNSSGRRENDDFQTYIDRFYLPLTEKYQELSKEFEKLSAFGTPPDLKPFLGSIRESFAKVFKQGAKMGYFIGHDVSEQEVLAIRPDSNRSWEEDYGPYSKLQRRREIGQMYARLLRKIATYWQKNGELIAAKEVFEEIFDIKQDLITDTKKLSKIYKDLWMEPKKQGQNLLGGEEGQQ